MDPLDPDTVETIAAAMRNVISSLGGVVIDALGGYRDMLLAAGYSEDAVEKMCVDMHHKMLSS